MEFTQEQLEREGYQLKAAPMDDWRTYDEHNPVPGYFEFDWLSARHPDLYHTFAQSTVGLMHELEQDDLPLRGQENRKKSLPLISMNRLFPLEKTEYVRQV